VRFKGVVPESEPVDRIEQFEFLFEQPKPSFNFPISLRMFHPDDDVIDVIFIEEVFERMVGEIAIPDRYELGTVVGQDLTTGDPPDSRNPWFRIVMVLSVVGESYIP